MRLVSVNVDRFLQYLAQYCNTTVFIYSSHLRTAATLLWKTVIVVLGKTVRQHTVHIRRSSSFNVKLWNFPPGFWPPNSPDLSSVDSQIWSMIQDRVYEMAVGHLTDLRQRLIDTWNSLSESMVDDAIDEWQKRLQACVNEKRGHFEHHSNWTWTRTGCADKLDVILYCATVMCI